MALLQSFRFRITVLFGSLLFAVTLVLSLAVGHLVATRLSADSGEALHGLAGNVASVLAAGLTERMKDIELLAASAAIGNWAANRNEAGASLSRLQRGGPGYAWAGLADASGVVQIATGNQLVGQSVRERPWFQAALSGPHLGDVHAAKLLAALLPASVDGGPARFVDFAAPVRAPDGSLRGVVGAHGHWDWAGEVVLRLRSDLARDQNVRVYILDRTGQVIHKPQEVPEPALGAKLGGLVLDVPERGGRLLTWPDGQRYLSTRSLLPDTPGVAPLGWSIVVRQPEVDAFATATSTQRTVALLGLVAVMLGMGCTWVVAGRASRPLRDMAKAAHLIEGGALEAHMPEVRGGSELAALARALENMTGALIRGQADLKRANTLLEDRVKERTEALALANEELARQARRDGLTGLHNRRSADEQLETELARHRRHRHALSLLMLDVDHFKSINDRFGHAVGDQALVAIAGCLVAHCRTTDMVARFGGEEFLVILPDTGQDAARRVAEKLRASVEALVVPVVGSTTVSIGLAVAPAGSVAPDMAYTADRMRRDADMALYQAKLAGRNRVV